MKSEHIALITTSYPIGEAGREAAGSFVADFVQMLRKHVSVSVIAPGAQNTDARTETGVREVTYRAPRQPLSILRPYHPADLLAIWTTLRNGSRALSNLIRDDKPDHLFALWVLPSGYWAMKAAQRNHIPYSTWALGSDIWTLGKLPIVKRILKSVLSNSQSNFADGIELKSQVAAISNRGCHFLPSTRDFPVSGNKKLALTPPYRLAYLGRWHINKGVDLLCDALMGLDETVWQRIKAVRICGGGPLEASIKAQSQNMKAKGLPVEVGGYLSKTEAADLLNWADYLLIPSRIDSIPVIFSDAMKAKCPVICTPVGDLPRLVADHKVGVVAKGLDSGMLATAIAKATKYPPHGFDLQLIRAAEAFNLERIIPKYLKHIATEERPA